MKKIILYTQNHTKVAPLDDAISSDITNYDAISAAAARLAEQINADVIICQTSSGATSEAIAAQRPNLPIISVTSNSHVANKLALNYANSSFVRPYSETYGLDLARELKESGYLQIADGKTDLLAVIVSGIKGQVAGTDTIQIRHI